jgi:uncharacterized cupin superfamily protein
MSERRHPNVVNIEEVAPTSQSNGKFVLEHRALGRAVSAKQLGCGMITIPPGKTAWPNHYHCANEESMYVLSGTGTARIGDAKVEIRAGDYIAFPTGKAHAHSTTNTGTEPLVYLCFSTMITTEVVGYPDSKKLAMSSWAFGEDGAPKPIVRAIYREKDQVGYFDGELEES